MFRMGDGLPEGQTCVSAPSPALACPVMTRLHGCPAFLPQPCVDAATCQGGRKGRPYPAFSASALIRSSRDRALSVCSIMAAKSSGSRIFCISRPSLSNQRGR